ALQQTAGAYRLFVTTAPRAPAAVELGRSAAEARMGGTSWRELVQRLSPDCTFTTPATPAQLRAAERALGVGLPDDLRGLLLETNGIVGRYGIGLVWPVERIAADNVAFRANADFRGLYMPFDHLLFFADEGSGDQYAF